MNRPTVASLEPRAASASGRSGGKDTTRCEACEPCAWPSGFIGNHFLSKGSINLPRKSSKRFKETLWGSGVPTYCFDDEKPAWLAGLLRWLTWLASCLCTLSQSERPDCKEPTSPHDTGLGPAPFIYSRDRWMPSILPARSSSGEVRIRVPIFFCSLF